MSNLLKNFVQKCKDRLVGETVSEYARATTVELCDAVVDILAELPADDLVVFGEDIQAVIEKHSDTVDECKKIIVDRFEKAGDRLVRIRSAFEKNTAWLQEFGIGKKSKPTPSEKKTMTIGEKIQEVQESLDYYRQELEHLQRLAMKEAAHGNH